MIESQWLASTDPAAMVAFLGEQITDEHRRFCVDAFIEMSGTTIGPAITWTAELANELFRMWCTQRNGFIKKVPWSLRVDILRDIVGNPFRRYERDWAGMPKEIAICRLWEGDTFSVLPLYEWLQRNDSAIPKMVDAMMFEECQGCDGRGDRLSCSSCRSNYNTGIDRCPVCEYPRGLKRITCDICKGNGRVPRAEPQWLMMPAIADALESAGCREPAILDHLRSERDGERCPWCEGGYIPLKGSISVLNQCPHCAEEGKSKGTGRIKRRHWRGCWAVELLKGQP